MVYDQNDFVLIYRWKSSDSKNLIIIAENKSSIALNEVTAEYSQIEDGAIQQKLSHRTVNIGPQEKKVIFAETVNPHRLRDIKITVKASDGTVFNATFPPANQKRLCFVTTAAYGSDHHPMVESFRSLRDEVLIHYSAGRKFIDWYDYHGPKFARIIEKRPLLCMISRAMLTPLALIINAIRGVIRN